MPNEGLLKNLRWAYLPECAAPCNGWRVVQFTEIAQVIAGQSPPSETYNEKREGLPFLQGNADFSFKYPEPALWCSSPVKIAEANDTLISVRAPVGELNRSDQRYAIGRGLAAIRAINANPDFVYHGLHRWRWSLQRVAQGTTFDAVTARHFSQLLVAVPDDPNEQATIAHILDAVDVAIEQVRQTLDQATVLQRTLIEDFFSKTPSTCKKLRTFTTDVRYGTSQASSERGWGHPVLRIPNVVADHLTLDDLAYADLRPIAVDRLALQDGDLLLVRTNGNPNYVGRSAVFRSPDQRTWIYASYLIRVRLNGELLPEYVNIFLSSERGRRELLRRVTTSAGNYNINSNSIRLLSIPVPTNPAAQQAVVDLANVMRAKASAMSAKLAALQQLKQSLLHDLLTGTVRVGDGCGCLAATPSC